MSKQLEYINSKIERLEYLIANPTQYNLTPTIKVRIDDSAVYKEELETLKTIKKALTTKSKKEQAFDVIKKYAVNDGWSNGWVIKFWDMDEEELELVNEVLKNE